VALAVLHHVVPGVIITVGVLALVDFDQPNFKLLDHFDWFGLIAMAGFLGALEYVLEEGPQYEWMQDTSVAICAWVCGISAIRLLLPRADGEGTYRRYQGLQRS